MVSHPNPQARITNVRSAEDPAELSFGAASMGNGTDCDRNLRRRRI
jgi:hypothetical protein